MQISDTQQKMMMRKEVRLQAMTRMLNYIICNDSDDCMQFYNWKLKRFLLTLSQQQTKQNKICAITNMPTLEQKKHFILMLARMEKHVVRSKLINH